MAPSYSYTGKLSSDLVILTSGCSFQPRRSSKGCSRQRVGRRQNGGSYRNRCLRGSATRSRLEVNYQPIRRWPFQIQYTAFKPPGLFSIHCENLFVEGNSEFWRSDVISGVRTSHSSTRWFEASEIQSSPDLPKVVQVNRLSI